MSADATGNAVILYDTTLRDGTQRAGISLSLADKLAIARRLDQVGIPYIEGGWPGSNPKDADFFRALRQEPLRQARLVAFASTRRPGATAHDDPGLHTLLAAETPAVCIVGKAWNRHVTAALGTTLEENLAMVRDTVQFLKAHGREVIFDAEHFFDGFAADPAYALAVLEAAAEAGADWIVLCDTNGGTLPDRLVEAVHAVRRRLAVPLGIHCHDDSGVAVANSLAAVGAGCTMVQGTVNGYGERCGNANLLTVAANLQLKWGRRCLPDHALAELTAVSRFVSQVANLPEREEAPFVGRNAFAHKAGIHVSALLKEPSLYEHIPPETVGNQRQVLVSELSGRSNLRYVLADRQLEEPVLAALLERIKELENQGYHFEGAEASLELLADEVAAQFGDGAVGKGPGSKSARAAEADPGAAQDSPAAGRPGESWPFQLESFQVTVEQYSGGSTLSRATVKVRVGDRVVAAAADGNGPVNALDLALRKALGQCYPELARVRLADYKVRVLEGEAGTGARVRVLVDSTDGQRRWGTVGVSANILEASWYALADGLRYYLLHGSRSAEASSSGRPADGLGAVPAAARSTLPTGTDP